MRSGHPGFRRAAVGLALALALWACPPPAAEARLHVIIAADRAQPGIGDDMELSRDAFLTAVVLNTPQDQCAVWEINPDVRKARNPFQPIQTRIQPFGDVLTRGTILGAIQALRVDPDDVVLFYYCGHGAYSPAYGTYTLPSGEGGRPGPFLSQVRDEIARKRPRFAAVVLDCCNKLRPLAGEPRPSVPFIQHRADFSPLFKELFLARPGAIAITSSKPNEYALIVPAVRSARGGEQHFGALFTKLFSREVIASAEDPLGWDDLLGKVQTELDGEFAGICTRGLIPLGNGKYVPQARQTIDYRR